MCLKLQASKENFIDLWIVFDFYFVNFHLENLFGIGFSILAAWPYLCCEGFDKIPSDKVMEPIWISNPSIFESIYSSYSLH